MKRLPFAVGLIAAWLLIVPVEAQNLEAELQRAAQQEMVSGNPKAAIAAYQGIVAKSGKNHGVAAQALLRMADAYRKLGDSESRKVYERLIRDYPDQQSAVEIARSHLGGAATLAYSLAWSGPKVDAEGTISPDGRYLSYTDWDTGNLALHDFEEKTDRPLTNGGTWAGQEAQYAEESTISRDGKQVAYSWFNSEGRYELRVLPVSASGFQTPRRFYAQPGSHVDRTVRLVAERPLDCRGDRSRGWRRADGHHFGAGWDASRSEGLVWGAADPQVLARRPVRRFQSSRWRGQARPLCLNWWPSTAAVRWTS